MIQLLAVSANALVLASAALLGENAVAFVQDPVTPPMFFVCARQLDDVALRPLDDQFIVTLQLTETGAAEWAAFTTQQVTRRVGVKVGSLVLVEADVQTPVRSGVIEIARPDQASAEALRTTIQDAPDSPCGADGRARSHG